MWNVTNEDIVEAGDKRIYTMRNGLSYWAKGAAIKTPDGKSGTAIVPASEKRSPKE